MQHLGVVVGQMALAPKERTMEGIVEQVVSAPGRGKAQGKTAWSIVVAGETYGVGFRRPEVQAGDAVRFRCEVKDGKWKSAYDLQRDSPGHKPVTVTPVTPSTAGDSRILAAAVILAAWASTSRPLDWSLEEFVSKVAAVAKELEKR